MDAPQGQAPVPADHLMGVYNRAPLAFVRGEGVRLWAEDGAEYLDCLAGIAVVGLGHGHPQVVEAAKRAMDGVWQTSNIFRIADQEKLAGRLAKLSGLDVAFFTNSGAEALECALKTVRKYHSANGQPERIDVIGFDGSFHGRTYATINAAGNPSYCDGFGPRLPGYVNLTYGDHDALKAAIAAPTTAAVLIEPVQGEGGARAVPEVCLRGLRALCDEHGVLLIYDEVQCGLGRTGKLFAHEWAQDARPDVMALAKMLGNGFPVGVCLATAEAARGMQVGAHGSTYGGNPVAMAVASKCVELLSDPEMLQHVTDVSGYFTQQLEGLKSRYPDVVVDVRGKGLLIGIKVVPNNRVFMGWLREGGLLVAGGGDNCVRLLPPLVITQDEAREAIAKLEAGCERARAEAKAAAAAEVTT